MHRLAMFACFAVLVSLCVSRAGELPVAKPEAVGMSAEKLSALTPALEKLVEEGKIAGGVTLIARRGKVIQISVFGYRDLAAKTPMTEDTIFAIASMTKPITCIALMTLVEQRKLGLDDPVEKYLPELKEMRVLGDRKDDKGDEIATIPAKRTITIRDLLSHTSGFSYGGFMSSDTRLTRSYAQAKASGRDMKTISEQVERLSKVALAHQPGEGWTYGLSHDVIGRVIEVVSGESFDKYLQEHLFAPLDMRDTSFLVPEAKRDRLATKYRAGADGKLVALPNNYGSATFYSGGGGLFSTARDYARFAQMLLNGGELEGKRIVEKATIEQMTTNQIGKLKVFGHFSYGLGFGLEYSAGKTEGSPELKRYFWGGYFSTNFWIDPRHELAAVIMTQVLPTNHGGLDGVVRSAIDSAFVD